MIFVIAGYVCTAMSISTCEPFAVKTLFATEEECSVALSKVKAEAEKEHLLGAAACTRVEVPGRDA